MFYKYIGLRGLEPFITIPTYGMGREGNISCHPISVWPQGSCVSSRILVPGEPKPHILIGLEYPGLRAVNMMQIVIDEFATRSESRRSVS